MLMIVAIDGLTMSLCLDNSRARGNGDIWWQRTSIITAATYVTMSVKEMLDVHTVAVFTWKTHICSVIFYIKQALEI